MNYFQDKITIVTGGSSGIGRALCEELVRRGAKALVIADIDGKGAKHVASSLGYDGCNVLPVQLDVAQAEDVRKVIADTYQEYGRLDLMFNNAGVAMCGDVRDMELDDWSRILDVNLWGVIYGSTAAYHLMSQQGFGHIVNTASLGGLITEPMATAYVTSKFAVVGLSMNLRAEAADLGVRVSVFCPGLVQTKALESAMYFGVNREDAISEMSFMQGSSPSKCAQTLLRGIEKNQAIITDTTLTRLFWWLYRLHPSLLDPFVRKGISDIRSLRFVGSDL
jgi:NAD(P)-dependent dehydrogenase (short-subunit alcohol dehydrogenase family)